MAGIGEASAVIGVVQVGFSLARTLSTYIGDYKDSRESIISLAVQLETTILHVRELNTLVRSSEAAGSVSEDSRKVAENAVTNSKRLIAKLVKLLTKADLPDDPDAIINIKPGDIDVRTLTKFYWPLVKPQVDVVALELQSMKTEILLARSCIQAQTGSTPAERAAGEESIVAFTKSKLLARRLLKEAKAEEKRAAMSAQQPGYLARAPPERNKPSTRYPSGPHRSGTYDSVSVDGRETDLMARDLRESILEDFQRKDAERKAKEMAEEAARKLAIEDYQQTVKEKLARLQQSTDTTQRRMKEIFGPHLDEKLVQKFLDEQQSGQMQDEFGEMLLKIGVVPPLPHVDLSKDAGLGSTGKDGVRKPKRRWFFKRHSSHSSAPTSVSNNAASIMSSGIRSPERTKFLHIVMSYDAVEGKYSYQTLDNPALRHRPCGPTCDFDETLKAWQALPRSVKQAAARWVDDNYSDRIWQLHAALPIQKDTRTTRKLLQKAVLGAVASQGMASIMLVFSSTENYITSDAGSTTAPGDSVSGSSHTYDPTSDGGVSRVELSQTDMEQMREWLTTRGLSTAKIAELEQLVVKQKESATAASATQPSNPHEQRSQQDDSARHDLKDAAMQADVNRQGSGSHVRFVTGDVAPPARHQSTTATAAFRGSTLPDRDYNRFYDYRQDYGRDIPSPPPRPIPDSSYDDDLPYRRQLYEHGPDVSKNPFYDDGYNPPRWDVSRVADEDGYRAEPRQSAYQRRDLEGLHRTRTEDELAYRDRHPQVHRQHSYGYNTSVDPSSYWDRDPTYVVRTRNTPAHLYNKVYEDPGRVPYSSQPVHSRSRDQRIDFNDELAERNLESRRRSHDRDRDREDSDTSSRSRGRHRSSERYVSERHEHVKPKVRGRASGDAIDEAEYARRKAEEIFRSKKEADRVVIDLSDRVIIRERDTLRRREKSPLPIQITERSLPAHQERQDIVLKPYDGYYLHGRDIHGRNNSGDKWHIHPGLTQTPRWVCHDDVPIPRELSPEPMLDDAEDAEDAALDDDELKNKMLVKYTGGTVANALTTPDRTGTHGPKANKDADVARENPTDPGAEIDDDGNRRDSAAATKDIPDKKKGAGPDSLPGLEAETPGDEPAASNPQPGDTPNSTTPIPGVQRHNTVTVEDYESDAETGTHRSRTRPSPRRATSSPSSASSVETSPEIVFRRPEARNSTGRPDHETMEGVD